MTRIRYPLTVYFDGACDLCRAQMQKYKDADKLNRLRFVDITSPDFNAVKHGLDMAELHKYIYVTDREGRIARGVEAFTWIWWAVGKKTRSILFRLIGIRHLARLGYKLISRFRYLFNQSRGSNLCRGKCAWRRY